MIFIYYKISLTIGIQYHSEGIFLMVLNQETEQIFTLTANCAPYNKKKNTISFIAINNYISSFFKDKLTF